MEDKHLRPNPGERIVLVGQTGSGKTTLARVLLSTRAYVVVLDCKGMIRWPGYHTVTRFAALCKIDPKRHPRVIYRPDWDEANDWATLDAFFSWVYQGRHRTCYVDELMAASRGDQYPPHFGACFTRGRELGVEMWTATQRPKRIPQVALSESEHVYAFRLKLEQDRLRVAELSGIDPDRLAALPKHDFLYSRQDADVQGPLRLDLVKKR